MVREARVWCDWGRLQQWGREEEKEGSAARMGKRGREGGGGGHKGVGRVRGAARVRGEGASHPSDANQQPKTHSLLRAPGPSERMLKKIYCFSEVSAS
jgi:hypothetical protein